MQPFTVFTAFQGNRRLVSGNLHEVATRVKSVVDSGSDEPILIYDDATGRAIDIDFRTLHAPVSDAAGTKGTTEETRGRGRPKLGVVAREVTLLPRHWEWLNAQPGGASVALRKLVEDARKSSGDRDRLRAAQEAAFYFMSGMAGNLPGFEEASRALFANDRRRFAELVAHWPEDIRDHVVRLAFSDRAVEAVTPREVPQSADLL